MSLGALALPGSSPSTALNDGASRSFHPLLLTRRRKNGREAPSRPREEVVFVGLATETYGHVGLIRALVTGHDSLHLRGLYFDMYWMGK